MSSPPLRAQPVGAAAARAAVLEALAMPPSAAEPELGYEVLRAVAWASTLGREPVHVRTLLDRAVDAHAAATLDQPAPGDDVRREALRSKLTELSRLGDVAELDGGRWISVPGVVVQIADGPDLLVSGVPLRALPPGVRGAVEAHGAARLLTHRGTADTLGLPQVWFADWTRPPPGTLEEWTRAALAEQVPRSGAEVGQGLQLYSPSQARPGAYQPERWANPSAALDGVQLARRTVGTYWRVYSLVLVEAGSITGVREIDPLRARRLMYGLDLLAGNPTVAHWTARGEDVELQLRNPLPAPEARALLALARHTTAATDSAARTWLVRRHRSQVRRLLTGLGVTLKDKESRQ